MHYPGCGYEVLDQKGLPCPVPGCSNRGEVLFMPVPRPALAADFLMSEPMGLSLRTREYRRKELAPDFWGWVESTERKLRPMSQAERATLLKECGLSEPERKTSCLRILGSHMGPHPDFPKHCVRCGHPLAD